MNIKKYFPHYDLVERKIKNVYTEDSLVYYHERRHEWQDKEGVLSALFMLTFWTVYFFVLLAIWKAQFIFATPYIPALYYTLIEVDAWIYAFNMKFFKVRDIS